MGWKEEDLNEWFTEEEKEQFPLLEEEEEE
jgi:hypothetical protein